MADADKQARKGYRALFDETTKAIKRGEKFEAALTKVLATKQDHEPAAALMASTRKGLKALRREAERLEKLGWPDAGDGPKT